MTRLVGFAGSLRKDSFNRALLRAAAGLVPDGATLDIVPIDGVPLYNADVESASGIPESVRVLKEAIAASDGLVIATPEYNNGIPGVAKNVIDWVSRPPADVPRILRGKRVALLGATPGGGGTMLAQQAWLPVLRTLRMQLWTGGGTFYLSAAAKALGPEGIVDHDIEMRLKDYLAAFIAYIRSDSAAHSDS